MGKAVARDLQSPVFAQLRENGTPDIAYLVEAVYPELRRIARSLMIRERPDHTVQPTAVVHEAVLKLLGLKNLRVENTEHFFSIVVAEMRRFLTSYARKKLAQKRNLPECTGFEEEVPGRTVHLEKILVVDQILDRLAMIDRRAHRTVTLRFFADLSPAETAAVMGVSLATVERDWAFARPWLYGEMTR